MKKTSHIFVLQSTELKLCHPCCVDVCVMYSMNYVCLNEKYFFSRVNFVCLVVSPLSSIQVHFMIVTH